LINQKSQELKLMEMMGGSLSPSFQENLVILAEIDGDSAGRRPMKLKT
jgi:hypothetical protein